MPSASPLWERRWLHGVRCPSCDGKAVIRDGCDDTQPCRQRCRCKGCGCRFDDLTGTVLAGHYQPLRMWLLCLFFMGLSPSDAQAMTEQLRQGLAARSPAVGLRGEVEIDKVYLVAGHKGQPVAVAKGRFGRCRRKAPQDGARQPRTSRPFPA